MTNKLILLGVFVLSMILMSFNYMKKKESCIFWRFHYCRRGFVRVDISK